MIIFRRYILLAMTCLATSYVYAKVVLTASNPTNCQRHEVIAWDAAQIWERLGVAEGCELLVTDNFGQTVDSQVTHDKKLLLDVALLPYGKAEFRVETGTKPSSKQYVLGQLYKYRLDDIAWENDITAYRVYGPALQQSGEQAFGIDIWLKSTTEQDVEKRYRLERLYNISYHTDHGTGLDCYNVGPSLGCGAPAVILDGDSIVMPYCYRDFKILDNGPLRFTLQLTYPDVKVNGQTVTEHRIISLDKGAWFNRMEVWYDGFTKPMDVAGGIAVHTQNKDDLTFGKNFIAYDDPTDSPDRHNFQIYTALVFPYDNIKTKFIKDTRHLQQGIFGNAVGVRSAVPPGEHTIYWFGASWYGSGTPDNSFWRLQIKRFADLLHQPVKVDTQ
jgi:hypothetical protein